MTLSAKRLFGDFSIFAMAIICVCGSSPYVFAIKKNMIFVYAVVSLILLFFKKMMLKLDKIKGIWFLVIVYLAIQCIYSYDKTATLSHLLVYASAYIMMACMVYTDEFMDRLIKVFWTICMVIAISIIASSFIDNLMLNQFGLIVNPSQNPDIATAIQRELTIGAHSGFARDKTAAAYIMNVGLGIVLIRLFCYKKALWKDITSITVFLYALFLTSKRVLFIVPFFFLYFYLLLVKKKNKPIIIGFCLVAVVLAVSIVLPLLETSSTTLSLVSRFLNKEDYSSGAGRNYLWPYIYEMIEKAPYFGYGFGSYNTYVTDRGFTSFGKPWTYDAHCMYLQAIAELGIIGAALLFISIALPLFKSIRFVREGSQAPDASILFALYIQILSMIHGATENTFYNFYQMFTWFLAINIVLNHGKHAIRRNKVR